MTDIRRVGDARLDDIIERLEALKDDLSSMKADHANFYGRMDERVLNHEKEIKKHADEIAKINVKMDRHEQWINIATGRVGALGVFFGFVGSVIGYVIDHFLVKGR